MKYQTSVMERPQLVNAVVWPGPLAPAVRDCIYDRLPDVAQAAEVNRLLDELREQAPHLRQLISDLDMAVAGLVAETQHQALEAGLYYGVHPERLILGEE